MDVIDQLFKHVAAGDLGAVRQWIDEHDYLVHVRNPNADAWDEQSLLHTAAQYGLATLCSSSWSGVLRYILTRWRVIRRLS